MSYHFEKSDEIGDQIYVYKSFLSKEEVEKYLNIIESINPERWIDGLQFEKPGSDTFSDKIFGNILKKMQDEIVPNGLFLEDTPSITRVKSGVGMSEHSDDCWHCKKIQDPSLDFPEKILKRCVKYGVVIYFSQFTGGEIYYPNQNVVFTPEPGDMIIHSTNKYCKHGVKPVIDGIRYSMAPYLVEHVKESDAQIAKEFWDNYKIMPL
jgi:hypothetical protein